MNLRKDPVKKKCGRPENQYTMTFKGYLYASLGQTSVAIEQFYDNLVKFAEKHTKKGQIPCIVFDNDGGSFIGVTRREE